MRRGVRIGVDVGSVRIGVATCDPEGALATPLTTVPRTVESDVDLEQICRHARDREALEVIVGLPLGMDGSEGQAAATIRAWARALTAKLGSLPVRLVDERLTTVDAHRAMRDAGRSQRSTRSIIDQQAAVLILQAALDSERNSGQPAGELVRGRKARHRSRPRKGNADG